ncbi:hypothetical protein SDRG_12487 [Saprolegnia diclina VS20]|uniref:Uncharacterized protein n=1 Tax=Saprolegnia diclina (strain VS20) TaxID=1156394 RepID=T0Q8B3_SAPDV|nr:hypothetical protein SDRG_12487 [Saprolegnia diclina VS20]EQC29715.1 hypothetical protein SDRG_12487 [Saprolegnia diclina VS20]|eukprot:XP_008616781.1 hypothetical protein SDRG_12487 [Saprolegnia diclina VS20]
MAQALGESISLNLVESFALNGHRSTTALNASTDQGPATFTAYRFIPNVALFSGRSDGKLLKWSHAPKGCLLLHGDVFGDHAGAVMVLEYLALSDKTGILFSGSADRTIKLWDATSTASLEAGCVQTLNGHGGTITVLRMAGSTLLSGSLDRTIKVWTRDKDRVLLRHPWFMCMQTLSTGGSWPTAVCLRLGDVTSMYLGDSSGGLSVYTASSRYLDRQVEGAEGQLKLKRLYSHLHTLGITTVLVISEQNLLVTLGFDDKAQLCDATSGVIAITIDNAPQHCRFRSCDWDKVHRELFFVDDAGVLSIWSLDSETCIKRDVLSVPATNVSVFTGSSGGYLMVQGASSAAKFRIVRDATYIECQGHTDAVIAVVAIVPDEGSYVHTSGATVFSASLDNTLRCWDPYDLHVLYGFQEKASELSAMAYSPMHHRLLTGSDDGTLKQWNVDNGHYSAVSQHKNTISCITVAAVDGIEYVFTGDYNGVFWIWEMMTGHAPPLPHCGVQTKERATPCELYCMAFNHGLYLPAAHAEYLAIGDSHGDIMLYGFDNQRLMITLSNHHDAVTCLAFDGSFLFSGSEDASIKIWNVLDPHAAYEVGYLHAHASPVRDLVVLPQTGYVVSCAHDGKVRVWNYQVCGPNGEYATLVHEFRKPERLHCLVYWPQRHALVCGTSDANVLVFDVPSHLTTAVPSTNDVQVDNSKQ